MLLNVCARLTRWKLDCCFLTQGYKRSVRPTRIVASTMAVRSAPSSSDWLMAELNVRSISDQETPLFVASTIALRSWCMHCFCCFVPSFHLAYLLSQSDLFGQGCADIAIYCAETQCFQSVGQPQTHPFFRSFLHGLMPSFEKYFLWDYSGLVHRFAHFFISTPCHVYPQKPRLPLLLCVYCARCLLLFLCRLSRLVLACCFQMPSLFSFLLVHLFVFASFLLQMFSSSLVQLALVPSQTSWHVKPHVQLSQWQFLPKCPQFIQ